MEVPSNIRILLPVCLEFQCDVFFNVIKNLIARSKLDGHFLDNAFKLGISGVKFSTEVQDITVAWLQQNSEEQKIRHAKLLGYWASANFPVLGKKFFGLKWQPPQRYGFQIEGHADEVSPEQIDETVFKKLKIRLIEMDVAQSTLQKLIRFVVDIPTNVGKSNETEFGSNIKSFDVDEECTDACWKLMKLGSQRSKSDPTVGRKLVQAAKRIHSEDSSGDRNVNTSETITYSIKSVLFEIKSEVGQLTDFVRAARSCCNMRDSQSIDHENNFHVLIFNQKDEEIARLKASSQELKEHNDRQSELINALQKGVESTSKLHIQAERDYATSLNTIAILNHEIAKLKAENQDIEAVKQDIEKLITENERFKIMNEKLGLENQTLVERLGAIETMKQEIAGLKKESQQLLEERYVLNGKVNVIEEMKLQIELLKTENQEAKDQNQKLQEELDTLSEETTCVMAEFKSSFEYLRLSPPETRRTSDMETQTETYSEVTVDTGSKVDSPIKADVIESSERIDFVSESNDTDIERTDSDTERKEFTDDKHEFVSDNNSQNCADQSASKPEFVTDDIIVIKCREMLMKLKFGWLKFQPTKCAKYSPGFVHPADHDGIQRAQKVTSNGYVSDEKNEFFDFVEDVPDEWKNKSGKTALRKLNLNFGFSHL